MEKLYSYKVGHKKEIPKNELTVRLNRPHCCIGLIYIKNKPDINYVTSNDECIRPSR